MLSDVSFDTIYSEGEVTSFDNSEKVALALLGSYPEGYRKKQFHKVAFLSNTDGMNIMPFKFKKHNYGPFSDELVDTIGRLEDNGLVEIKEKKIHTYKATVTKLSKKGKEAMKKDKDIQEIAKVFKSIISQYIEDGVLANGEFLETYCYKSFNLKKDEFEKEWQLETKNRVEELRCVINNRITNVGSMDNLDQQKKDVILMYFDYLDNLLLRIYETVESKNMDQVLSGILIKFTEKIMEKWGELISLENDVDSTEDTTKRVKEANNLFKFVNQTCTQYTFFESVYV